MITEEVITNVTNQAYQRALGAGLGEWADDMVQVALAAVVGAAESYKGSAEFTTYAYGVADRTLDNWILERQHSVVPVPRGAAATLRRAAAVERALEQELGRPPANREVAAALNMELDEYEAVRTRAELEQVDPSAGGDPFLDPEAETFEGTVAGEGVVPTTETLAMNVEREGLIEHELDRLTTAEAATLALLFGLRDNHVHTLREVSEILEISHEMVRRHRDRALGKLRARLPADMYLDPVLDEERTNA